jgi:hypothetical protein
VHESKFHYYLNSGPYILLDLLPLYTVLKPKLILISYLSFPYHLPRYRYCLFYIYASFTRWFRVGCTSSTGFLVFFLILAFYFLMTVSYFIFTLYAGIHARYKLHQMLFHMRKNEPFLNIGQFVFLFWSSVRVRWKFRWRHCRSEPTRTSPWTCLPQIPLAGIFSSCSCIRLVVDLLVQASSNGRAQLCIWTVHLFVSGRFSCVYLWHFNIFEKVHLTSLSRKLIPFRQFVFFCSGVQFVRNFCVKL